MINALNKVISSDRRAFELHIDKDILRIIFDYPIEGQQVFEDEITVFSVITESGNILAAKAIFSDIQVRQETYGSDSLCCNVTPVKTSEEEIRDYLTLGKRHFHLSNIVPDDFLSLSETFGNLYVLPISTSKGKVKEYV